MLLQAKCHMLNVLGKHLVGVVSLSPSVSNTRCLRPTGTHGCHTTRHSDVFMVFTRHVLHLITSYQVSPYISAAGTVTVYRRTDSDSTRMLHRHAHLFYTGFLHSAVRLQEESRVKWRGAEGLYSEFG